MSVNLQCIEHNSYSHISKKNPDADSEKWQLVAIAIVRLQVLDKSEFVPINIMSR